MSIRVLGVACVAMALGLLGCATEEQGTAGGPTAGNRLGGTQWMLEELNGQAVLPADIPARSPHLQFDVEPGRIAGSGGINRFMGTYALTDGALRISPGGMTMMAGPEPLMQQEQAFMKALGEVRSHRIDGKRLQLLDGSGKVLAVFSAKPAP